MAERQLYSKDFNSVAMPTGRMQEAEAIAGAVQKVGIGLIQMQEKQDELKMIKYSSEAEQAVLAKTEEIRLKHIDNPTSPEARQEFSRAYDKIYSEYDSNFSRFSVGKWKGLRDTSKQQLDIANTKWARAQNAKNAQVNLNSGIETALNTAHGLGTTGDIEGAIISAETKEMQLRQAVEGVLPQSKINEDMKNFKSDYMRNFVLGLAEKNPEQAFTMLENDKVKETLGNEETLNTLKKVVEVNKSKAEIGLYRKQLENHAKYDLEVEGLNVGQQLTKLQSGAKSGEYDNKWAESKEAVILSTKKLNAVTQVEKHGEFLTRKADILSMYEDGEINEKEYLREVNKFELDMNNAISNGEIKEYDGEKAINSLRQKLGEATTKLQGEGKFWGFSEKKAYEGFQKNLPATVINKAKRDYFKEIDGKGYDAKTMETKYTEILSKYKNIAVDTAVKEQAKPQENKTQKYSVGQVVTMKGKKYEITGFNDNGTPKGKLVE